MLHTVSRLQALFGVSILEDKGHARNEFGMLCITCTELYYITGGPAREKKVKPKTWRISAFADAISMTTGPYFSW
jgi:hypothetical protein